MNRIRPATRFRRRPLATAVLLAGLGLLLGACSAIGLAYERLDWLARWELGRYVSLDKAQTATFDAGFAEVWRWHRNRELPLWIAELRQLATVDVPLSAEQIDALATRYGDSIERSVAQLVPLACKLGATLDDAQVDDILEAVDDDIDDYREEQIEPDDAAVRKFNLKNLEKSLRRNVGALTPGQQAQLRTWNKARPSVAPDWLAYRLRWRTELAAALKQRQAADFCPALTRLLVDGESLLTAREKQVFAANRAQWLKMFAELGPSLDAEQRARLRERLTETADELTGLLAAEAVPGLPAATAAETPAASPAAAATSLTDGQAEAARP